MTRSLTERYDERIAGVLSCYDRVVITGTVPVICYAEGMTRFLHAAGIRIFDYPQFAMKLRDRIRGCAASLAAEAGVPIDRRRAGCRGPARGARGAQLRSRVCQRAVALGCAHRLAQSADAAR